MKYLSIWDIIRIIYCCYHKISIHLNYFTLEMDISWTKSNTCRICLQKCDSLKCLESFSGFVFMDLVFDVNEKLLRYTDVPDKCCASCEAELKASQDFKLKCDSSNEALIKFYESIPTLVDTMSNSNTHDAEDKTKTDTVEKHILSDEPVIDHNKRFSRDLRHEAQNKKFKSFAFPQEKEVVDLILGSKLKTLSVKEFEGKSNPEDPNQVTNTSKSSNDKMVCEICNYVAPYPSALSCHLRTHTKEHSFSCELCAKTFSKISALNKHKFLHSDDAQFGCDVCGKQYTFKTSLVEHMSAHSSEKFICETCKKVFISKLDLELHARRHVKDGQFVCDICGTRRVSKHSLDIHKRVHSGQHQYPCQDCSYKTVSKASLQIHQRTHSGERPFCCPQCPDSFISGLQMTRHLIKMHRMRKLITD